MLLRCLDIHSHARDRVLRDRRAADRLAVEHWVIA
jgi:hypothetical protein